MEIHEITINGKPRRVEADPDMPLLWILRDMLGLTGAKYGCGRGLCGACTVHVDGRAVRACMMKIGGLSGRSVTTIEGLGADHDENLHPVQGAWIEADVPQCGFCQAGQVMQAASLLRTNPDPAPSEVDAAMNGNLCRCGTYTRVRKAIDLAAQRMRDKA